MFYISYLNFNVLLVCFQFSYVSKNLDLSIDVIGALHAINFDDLNRDPNRIVITIKDLR